MTSKSPVRTAEDIDEASLSYAEIKMLATGNPHIKEKMDLDIQVARLRLLKQNFLSEKYELQDRIVKYFPAEIKRFEEQIAGYEEDISYLKEQEQGHPEENFMMEIKGKSYTEKTDAGEALLSCCKEMKSPEPVKIGSYRGFEIRLSFDTFSKEYAVEVKHHMRYRTPLGTDARGNISRIENLFSGIEKKKNETCDKYENILKQYENAKVEVEKSFEHENELAEKERRLVKAYADMISESKDAVCIFTEEFGGDSMRMLMNYVLDAGHCIYAVFFGNEKDGYRYVLGSRQQDVREMAKEFNKRFDGRGGGKPEMVQGTVRGEKEAIERWLMKYEFVCI